MTNTTSIPDIHPSSDAYLLASYEAVIKEGIKTFIEVGNALCRIRDGKLYRATHSTFEDYCRERWNFTDRYARNLISAAEIGTTVPEIQTESQARELAKVEPEQRQHVIEAATEATGGKLTAKAIRDAAAAGRPQVKRFDAQLVAYEFFKLARRLAKATSESRHDDLLDAATKGIHEGIRQGAIWREGGAK